MFGELKNSPLIIAGTILVVLGLICDVIILRRFLPVWQLRIPPKPWGLRVLAGTMLVLAGLLVISNGLYWLLALLLRQHRNLQHLLTFILPMELLLRVGVLAGFAAYFRSRRINLRQAIGLDVLAPGPAAGWGVAFCLASLPPVGAFSFVTTAVYRLLHLEISEQPIIEMFLHTHSAFLLVVLLLFAISVAPVFEEFLFRGFAYPVLKQRFGFWPALLIVSLIFALSHFHGPSFLPLFVFSLGLCLAYELTGSLLAPITMHALFNAIMTLQIFYQRAHP